MTKIDGYKEFTADSGQQMFIERYADAPNFVYFWRYGALTRGRWANIYKDGLTTRPNIKQLKKKY